MKNLLLILFVFLTTFVKSQCTHTIRLTDTYGDGWNGGTVSVSVGGVVVLNNITLTSGFGPVNFNFTASSGQTIRVYRINAGSWPTEMRVQIVNNVSTILLNTIQPVNGSATTGGQTCIANCSAPPNPCTSITTITSCGTNVSTTMTGSGTGWNIGSCGFTTPGQERIFQFTPATTGTYTFNVTAISGGYIDFFWKPASGGCNATGWNCIRDINVTGSYNAITPMTFTAGVTYYILADPEVTTATNVTFNIGCPVVPTPTPITVTENSAGTINDGTICSSASATLTTSVPVGGTVYWYTGSCGGTAAGIGNSIIVSPTTTTTYFARNLSGGVWSTCVTRTIIVNNSPTVNAGADVNVCQASSVQLNATASISTTGTLTTTTAGGNGCGGGSMFNIVNGATPVTINGFTIYPNMTGTQSVKVYYRVGSYVGNETNAGTWILLGTYSINGVTSAPVYMATANLNIPASSTYGIYVNFSAQYTTVAAGTTYSNADMTIGVGCGLCGLFSGTNFTRAFNGTVHYTKNIPTSISWFPATGLSNPNILNPIASPTSTTNYTLTATVNGCSTSDVVTVTYNNLLTGYVLNGAHKIWAGTTSTNWQTVSNWRDVSATGVYSQATQIPGNNDDVIVPSVGTCVTNPVVVPSGNHSCDSLIIQGSVTLNSGVNFTAHEDVRVLGGGTLSFNDAGNTLDNGNLLVRDGNLIVNGTLIPGLSTIEFFASNGNTDGYLVKANSTSYTFYNLGISNAIGQNQLDLKLGSNITVLNNLSIGQRNFDLNNYQVDLGTTGTLVGETSNGKRAYQFGNIGLGSIKRTINIPNGYNGDPANLGLNITNNGLTMGSTIIIRYHDESVLPNGPSATRRFHVTPGQNNGNLNLNLSFDYHDLDITAFASSENTLGLYRKGDNPGDQFVLYGGNVQVNNNIVTYNNFTQFSEVTIGPSGTNTALPIELVSFQVNCSENNVANVSWTTASEYNTDYYILDKSRDGIVWETLGLVPAAGYSTELITYSHKDYSLNQGINYYRLTQYDKDGVFETFDIQTLVCNDIVGGTTLSTYPNPSSNDFTITLLTNEIEGKGNIVITDVKGSVLYNQEINVVNGVNNFLTSNLKLEPGMYQISIIVNEYVGTTKQSVR